MSKIQWTGLTWNPIVGCSKCSRGCMHCYAIRQAHRCAAMGIPQYQGLTIIQGGRPNWTGEVRLVEHKLDEPLHWRTPRKIFVNSMSDLFHEDVSISSIVKIAEIMLRADWHIYQVLTKRSERLRDLPNRDLMFAAKASHIWWGVSVEDSKQGVPRVSHLRAANVPVRFLSIEPLLEDIGELDLTGIHWVIVGGESGPGARPFDIAWARSVIRQCQGQSVPCFVKQLGTCPVENGTPFTLSDYKGGDWGEWPTDLRVREYPGATSTAAPKRIEDINSSLQAKRKAAALKAWQTRRAKQYANHG
jgi:protein gp37